MAKPTLPAQPGVKTAKAWVQGTKQNVLHGIWPKGKGRVLSAKVPLAAAVVVASQMVCELPRLAF